MKAVYIWRTGPLAGTEVVVDRATMVKIGPNEYCDLRAPGGPDEEMWADVRFERKRCFLTNVSAPRPIVVVRKVKGTIHTLSVERGSTMETKSNDLLRLGEAGPEFLCIYELDSVELGRQGYGSLPEAVSPASAFRRQERAAAESFAAREEVRRAELSADEARQNAGIARTYARSAAVAVTKVEEKVGREGVRWRRRTTLLLTGGVVALALAGAIGHFLLRRAEARLVASIQEVASASGGRLSDYEANRDSLSWAREDAGAALERLSAEIREMRARGPETGPAVEVLLEEMRALQIGAGAESEAGHTPAAIQDRVDSSIFLVISTITASTEAFRRQSGTRPGRTYTSMGTGFVVDAAGTMVTCKHVVRPEEYFPAVASALQSARATVTHRVLAAFPVGHPLRDLDGDHAPTTENGRLEIVAMGGEGSEAGDRTEQDIAVLRLKDPVRSFIEPLPRDAFERLRGRKAWAVMLAGFPMGVDAFESGRVESSWTVGNVRKVARTIQHTAPTCSGNSGGPLLDLSGRVVGIVAASRSSPSGSGPVVQNLNYAVPVTAIWDLLEGRR